MNIATSPSDLFIGIMSGTSLDGIDVVIVRFSEKIECLALESFPFEKNFRDLLYEFATAKKVGLDELVEAHFSLAALYADAVGDTLERSRLTSKDIRAIGVHGQTVRHLPQVHATFQLGSGAALAARTGIDVVSDFRSADVAVGGQGAPLVPMFDAVFLRDDTADRATLNIGGIANITILPSRKSGKDVTAYDTGPGNMLIDELMRRFFDKPFDRDGAIAASGTPDEDVLTKMLLHDFFSSPAPKSAGRELFGGRFLDLLVSAVEMQQLSPADAVATASELTARSAAFELKSWSGDVIVSGGGVKNLYVMDRLRKLLPNCHTRVSDEFGIPSQAKEAIAFAYFAKAFLDETQIHLPNTTGANRKLILGSLSRG